MDGAAAVNGRLRARWWPPLGIWLLSFTVLLVLDEQLDLANEALILVLSAALAALWMRPGAVLLSCAAAVLVFNFGFVPPRGSLAIDLPHHALLLLTMLGVSWLVALLVARQRRLVMQADQHAAEAGQLRQWGEALREADDPWPQAPALQQTLGRLTGGSVTLCRVGDGALTEPVVGEADTHERAGLLICAQQNQAMGPGTGRHEEQPAWYLPLRGRAVCPGAALLRLPDDHPPPADVRRQAQALCDQMGSALDRAAALHSARQAHESAQAQSTRNTLLAAISHDHRTPLATILGAASALHDQAERLAPEQRRRLASTIIDEARQLTRLTENTLQLARLDAPGLALSLDWESAEELVGSVMRRLRQRWPGHRVKAHVAAGLPLLHCDAVLLVQLLDNLVDNALNHGAPVAADQPPEVEIVARQQGDRLLLAVRDRGPGVPLAQRAHIFEAYQRGDQAGGGGAAHTGARRGAGVGLAVCRAIARVHGGELRCRARSHGGTAFELWLPVHPAPQQLSPAPAPELKP